MISTEREEWEVALELWRYVVAATSLSPTLSSYSAVIRACSEGGFWGGAWDFIRDSGSLAWQWNMPQV